MNKYMSALYQLIPGEVMLTYIWVYGYVRDTTWGDKEKSDWLYASIVILSFVILIVSFAQNRAMHGGFKWAEIAKIKWGEIRKIISGSIFPIISFVLLSLYLGKDHLEQGPVYQDYLPIPIVIWAVFVMAINRNIAFPRSHLSALILIICTVTIFTDKAYATDYSTIEKFLDNTEIGAVGYYEGKYEDKENCAKQWSKIYVISTTETNSIRRPGNTRQYCFIINHNKSKDGDTNISFVAVKISYNIIKEKVTLFRNESDAWSEGTNKYSNINYSKPKCNDFVSTHNNSNGTMITVDIIKDWHKFINTRDKDLYTGNDELWKSTECQFVENGVHKYKFNEALLLGFIPTESAKDGKQLVFNLHKNKFDKTTIATLEISSPIFSDGKYNLKFIMEECSQILFFGSCVIQN